LPEKLIGPLLEHARNSIASLDDDTVAELVRDQVRQLRDVDARQLRLEKTLVDAYRRLPDANHLDSIPGIGAVTAAILTAFILDIDRFATPTKLVAYFGVMPIKASSGVDRAGKPRAPKGYVMSSLRVATTWCGVEGFLPRAGDQQGRQSAFATANGGTGLVLVALAARQ
jgi:transposase